MGGKKPSTGGGEFSQFPLRLTQTLQTERWWKLDLKFFNSGIKNCQKTNKHNYTYAKRKKCSKRHLAKIFELLVTVKVSLKLIPLKTKLLSVLTICQFLPSSAFFSHSTNFFICSRKMLLPLVRWPSEYHFSMASSLRTSAKEREDGSA